MEEIQKLMHNPGSGYSNANPGSGYSDADASSGYPNANASPGYPDSNSGTCNSYPDTGKSDYKECAGYNRQYQCSSRTDDHTGE